MQNKQYKKLLKQMLSIKSISTDPIFKPEIEKMVGWLADLFAERGFVVKVVRNYGNPIVVADYLVDKKLPTCLVYGHYDVQPANIEDGWSNQPFELTEKNGRLYGRGVVDNKGQVLIHINSVLELIKEKNLAFNVKFMIEGDEETGSSLMEKFVKDNQGLLLSDFCLISDGEMNIECPVIESGFRGGFNSTLTITTSSTDLHSGIYGGAVPSAAHEMARVIASLFNDDGSVRVPGFYDDVDVVGEVLETNNQTIPFDEKDYLTIAGVKRLTLDKGIKNVVTQTGLTPTIQVTGLQTGYMGEGYRNSIPGKASAKINFRLVRSQDNTKVMEAVTRHIRGVLPDYAEFTFRMDNPFSGVKLDLQSKEVKRTKLLLEKIYGKQCFFKFSGGGLPIATLFSEILRIPCVLVPLANEDCRMHATDENYDLVYLTKAMEFSKRFLGAAEKRAVVGRTSKSNWD